MNELFIDLYYLISFKASEEQLCILLSDIGRELPQDDGATLFGFPQIICTVVFANADVFSQGGALFDGRKWHIILFAQGLDQFLVVILI